MSQQCQSLFEQVLVYQHVFIKNLHGKQLKAPCLPVVEFYHAFESSLLGYFSEHHSHEPIRNYTEQYMDLGNQGEGEILDTYIHVHTYAVVTI